MMMIKLFSTPAEQSRSNYYCLINLFTYKLAILTIILLTHQLTYSQGVSINSTGNAADASAMLDISSTAGGLLIPRMDSSTITGISSPATSLLVYQTDKDSGFYFYDGTNWTPLLIGGAGTNSGWSTTGNAGTTAGTNFIGTTDAVDWQIKTNNTERLRVSSGGDFIVRLGNSQFFQDGGGSTTMSFNNGSGAVGSASDILFDQRGLVASEDDMYFRIDSDNDATGDFYDFGKDSETSAGTSLMRIQEDGNVGVGTTAPTARLQIGDATVSTANQLIFGKYETSTQSNLPVIQHKSVLSSGNSNGLALGARSTSGGILFYTGNNLTLGTGSNELRMVINADGNVGIGTTTPTTDLVLGNNVIRLNAANNVGAIPDIHMNAGGVIAADNALWIIGDADNDMNGAVVLATGDSNTTDATARVRVIHTGNVGVGTDSPDEIFHIVEGTSGSDPPMLRIQAETEANTTGGQFYAGIEMGVNGGENSAGTQHITAYVKAVDTRTASTSFEDGGLAFGTLTTTEASPSTKMTLTHDGDLGIGTASPGGQLELSLDEGRKPSTTLWTTTSDERLKTIKGTYQKGLQEVLALSPIIYHYKNTEQRTFPREVLEKESIGFSAQEVQKIFPECVGIDEDGFLNLNPHAIVIAYTNAVKELNAKIENQEEIINSLRNDKIDQQVQVETLKAEIDEIKKILNQQTKK